MPAPFNTGTDPSDLRTRLRYGGLGLRGWLATIMGLLSGDGRIKVAHPLTRVFGHVVHRRRVMWEWPISLAPNALTTPATNITWSQMLEVDQFDELIVTVSLSAAATHGTAVSNLTLYVQTLDLVLLGKLGGPALANMAKAGVNLPGTPLVLATPGDAAGTLGALFLTNVGSAIRVGIAADVAWTNTTADGLMVSIQAKG